VIDRVMAEEVEIRKRCKRGREYNAIDGSGKQTSSPEWEHQYYRKHERPVHKLLRGWCGHGRLPARYQTRKDKYWTTHAPTV
jgi:hypothetical protein